jgi:four helix bundle protein
MKYDLEQRLIDFAVIILRIVASMPADIGSKVLAMQIARSGTSPALNYGEAQGAESRRDFIHKMRTCLKELRETQVCLKIVSQACNHRQTAAIESALKESSELVAIFVKSLATASKTGRT